MRTGVIAALLTATVVALSWPSRPGRAHPELVGDALDAYAAEKGTTDPEQLKDHLKYELRPVFLSPTSNVHETMTAGAFDISGILGRSFDVGQDIGYIKGVYWNDSPERGLCAWCSTIDANQGAFTWYKRFKAAQRLATDPANPKFFTHGDPVFERSHYGDLAVIHAMAVKNGIPARETRRRAMTWAEFTYKVASGAISETTKVRDVGVAGFEYFFNSADAELYDQPLTALFKDTDVKANALGSLLHLVQDSYSAAHVEREVLDESESRFCRTGVRRFLSYPNQVVKKHSAADKWPTNLFSGAMPDGARVCDPLRAGAAVLKLYKTGKDWPTVAAFLNVTVFNLLDPDAVSGPGQDFSP